MLSLSQTILEGLVGVSSGEGVKRYLLTGDDPVIAAVRELQLTALPVAEQMPEQGVWRSFCVLVLAGVLWKCLTGVTAGPCHYPHGQVVWLPVAGLPALEAVEAALL